MLVAHAGSTNALLLLGSRPHPGLDAAQRRSHRAGPRETWSPPRSTRPGAPLVAHRSRIAPRAPPANPDRRPRVLGLARRAPPRPRRPLAILLSNRFHGRHAPDVLGEVNPGHAGPLRGQSPTAGANRRGQPRPSPTVTAFPGGNRRPPPSTASTTASSPGTSRPRAARSSSPTPSLGTRRRGPAPLGAHPRGPRTRSRYEFRLRPLGAARLLALEAEHVIPSPRPLRAGAGGRHQAEGRPWTGSLLPPWTTFEISLAP